MALAHRVGTLRAVCVSIDLLGLLGFQVYFTMCSLLRLLQLAGPILASPSTVCRLSASSVRCHKVAVGTRCPGLVARTSVFYLGITGSSPMGRLTGSRFYAPLSGRRAAPIAGDHLLKHILGGGEGALG